MTLHYLVFCVGKWLLDQLFVDVLSECVVCVLCVCVCVCVRACVRACVCVCV